MKLRTTTPASISLRARLSLIFIAILMATASSIQFTSITSADQYDDKINALQQDINAYQVEANRLNGEAATLQSALAQIANEKSAIQAQIDLNQAKYDQLVVDIAATEKKIKDNQDALGQTIADLYIDGKTSPLEMLASSTNIGQYLDKQTFRSSIRDQLGTTIKDIKDLKTKLDTQKTDVQKVLAEQQSAKNTLVAKGDEQQGLLNRTNNDEATYQQMINSNQSQIAAAKATQAALAARTRSTGGYQLVDAGLLPDYPWNNTNCPMSGYYSLNGSNGNGGDGHNYGCRQCVSYVAWRIAKATGVYYNDLGNGGSAGYNLVNQHGYRDLGRNPQSGSVAVLWGISSSPYSTEKNPGHVAYVEEVSADGSKVRVTQYSYDYGQGYGLYSDMWLARSFFDQYVKL